MGKKQSCFIKLMDKKIITIYVEIFAFLDIGHNKQIQDSPFIRLFIIGFEYSFTIISL